MELGDISFACASSLVAGLVDGGVSHAALSPGSRSTPLALALARDPRVQVHVQLDERSGGFLALGAAKATGRPAVVACTSGTAAAELLPVVVEASQARVPLVVLTADRPPRLRGTGANQTIVQPGLYGEYVHASFDLPVPSTAGQEAWWRQAAREALEAMATDPTGPVHLNCPFEEPLTPTTDTPPIGGDVVEEPFAWPPRPAAELDPDEADRLAELVSGARGAVVFGGWPGHLSGEGRFWAELLGWPVLAEPTSGARQPESSLAAGQAVIAGAWAETHRPGRRDPVRCVPHEPGDAAVRGLGRAPAGGGSMAPRSRPGPSRLLAARGGPRGAPERPRGASRDPRGRHRVDRTPFEGRDRGVVARPDPPRAARLDGGVARGRRARTGRARRVDGRMGRAVRAADRARHGLVDPGRGATVRGELDADPRPRSRDAPAGEPDGHGQSRSERDRRARVDGAGDLGRPRRNRWSRSSGTSPSSTMPGRSCGTPRETSTSSWSW